MMYSIVIPVYKNEDSLPQLIEMLVQFGEKLDGLLEVVFVVDGSPDRSFEVLKQALPSLPFAAQLLAHSRNFGSFAAIRTGLRVARGDYFAVIAADLQEPPELTREIFNALSRDQCDVAVGTRQNRADPLLTRITSDVFWWLYRRFVLPEMPPGGVDVFGCNRPFRDQLMQLEEARSSLVALIFWLGFRRKQVPYARLVRQNGTSSWTLRKKVDYMMDSVFAFTDYPIRVLTRLGATGIVMAVVLGAVVLTARLTGAIAVPGYSAVMVSMLGLGALNLFGLGLIGNYAWRAYENSKSRPLAVVAVSRTNDSGAQKKATAT